MEARNALTRTSTLSKTSSLGLVWGIAEWVDGTIILSDAERHTICNLVLPSAVNVIAGSGTPGFIDGVGDKAQFNTPKGIALTEEANVLVADSSNHRIRIVSSSGTVSTLSGTGKRGSTDGPAKNATWDLPVEIAHISSGPNENRILVASFSSPYLRCIHEGIVSTLSYQSITNRSLAGSVRLSGGSLSASNLSTSSSSGPDSSVISGPPSSSIPPSSSQLGPPSSKAALAANGPVSPDLQSPIFAFVRQVGSPHLSRVLTQLEDRLMNGSAGLVDGTMEEACFKSLNAMISNNRGDLIVMDCANHAIRLITIEGKVVTISGAGYSGHRDGIPSQTKLSFPRTMLLTKQGEILIADTGNCCLRRIELPASLRSSWEQGKPKQRHFNFLLPIKSSSATSSGPLTEKSNPPSSSSHIAPIKNSIYTKQEPRWTDLVWGTSNAGTWRLHRCILFPRCPSLVEASVQTAFLDMKVSARAFGAFWEYIYNDQFPVSKGDFASASLFVELIALFKCVKLKTAEEYASWILGYTIDSIVLNEEILRLLPELININHVEMIKTIVRIISKRTDNPTTEEAMKQLILMVAELEDQEFHAWLKRRSSSVSNSSYSRKLGDKPPPSPFGYLERDLGALLIRDEQTGRIAYPDMTLKAAVDQLSCHRAILYKRWPLLMPHIENSTLENMPLVVSLPEEVSHMRISSLYGILWYFYTGSLEKLTDQEECTDLAQIWTHLKIDDAILRAYILQNGFVEVGHEAGTEPATNLWIQPAEPPASSCSIQ